MRLNERKFIKYFAYYWLKVNNYFSSCDHFLHGFHIFWSVLPSLVLVPPHVPSTQLSGAIFKLHVWSCQSPGSSPSITSQAFLDKVQTPWLAYTFLHWLGWVPSDPLTSFLILWTFAISATERTNSFESLQLVMQIKPP